MSTGGDKIDAAIARLQSGTALGQKTATKPKRQLNKLTRRKKDDGEKKKELEEEKKTVKLVLSTSTKKIDEFENEEQSQENKAEEQIEPDEDNDFDTITNYIAVVKDLSLCSEVCREFLAKYKEKDINMNDVFIPITKTEMDKIAAAKGELPEDSIFSLLKKEGYTHVAFVGASHDSTNQTLSHLLEAYSIPKFSQRMCEAIGSFLEHVSAVAFDCVILSSPEDRKNIANAFKHLTKLWILGWNHIKPLIEFTNLESVIIERTLDEERFFLRSFKLLPNLKNVHFKYHIDEGTYNTNGFRANACLPNFENELPNVKFETTTNKVPFEKSTEYKSIFFARKALIGLPQGVSEPQDNTYLGLESEKLFPTLGAAVDMPTPITTQPQQPQQSSIERSRSSKNTSVARSESSSSTAYVPPSLRNRM
eukprot:m.34168 g.34168  ORF g.34168 m.34168 type:complete len:422 (+) comp6501_c0_seq1:71-1336(+)